MERAGVSGSSFSKEVTVKVNMGTQSHFIEESKQCMLTVVTAWRSVLERYDLVSGAFTRRIVRFLAGQLALARANQVAQGFRSGITRTVVVGIHTVILDLV